MSPSRGPPSIALAGTSERRTRKPSARLVQRIHHGLRAHAPTFVVFSSRASVSKQVGHTALSCPSPRVRRHVIGSAPWPAEATRDPHPLMGFPYPTTLEEERSDLHQTCLAWLRQHLRLSQPLGALLRAQPFRPYFVPVTPLGFSLQRVPLRSSELAFQRPCPPCRSTVTAEAIAPRRLRGFAHLQSPLQRVGVTR